MKPLLLIFLYSLLIGSGCRKHKTKNPVDQLPSETQTGANTFGCLVNGQPLTPKGSALSGPNLACIYQYIISGTPSGYTFALAGTDKKDPCNIRTVGFGFDSIKMQTGIYQLKIRKNGQGGGGVNIGICNFPSNNFHTNELVVGQLELKKFDEINQIASGTFWFNAVNDQGDTIKVTDGRFDVRYTR
jgi:hypothetical protein